MKTLTVVDENKVVIDGKTFIHLSDDTPNPEFKVGDWAKFKIVDDTYGDPFKIIRFKGGETYGDCFNGVGEVDQCESRYLYPVPPKEIKSYLKKICDEKGLTKHGILLTSAHGLDFAYNMYSGTQYLSIQDEFRNGSYVLYCRGQFAEIRPQEFKELPKTIEELRNLILRFKTSCSRLTTIDVFLKEQGYKVD